MDDDDFLDDVLEEAEERGLEPGQVINERIDELLRQAKRDLSELEYRDLLKRVVPHGQQEC